MMTLRFGTDTGCFGEEIIPSGMNKSPKNRIPDFADGDIGKNQPAPSDLSSGVGGMRWLDKVENLMEALSALRSWRQGLSD
jgi:hypothetical protein